LVIIPLIRRKDSSGIANTSALTARSNITATMGGVPSVPTDPRRSMKVIGAGYSRTGTLSMAFALEKLLDGPEMHGGSQLLGREGGRDPT
jgi:hypothetical protein